MKRLTIDTGPFEINGLPWYNHNGKRFWRLPYEIENSVSRKLWEISQFTTGARITFCSDASTLGIHVKFRGPGRFEDAGMERGFDLYADGRFYSYIWCSFKETEYESIFFENTPRKLRQYAIYMPSHAEIETISIFFDDDAEVMPPAAFSVPKPIVFYGTSVTAGTRACRSGLSYEAVLARKLDVDFVNLGFGGHGKGDKPVARAISEIDAACYVLDFGPNNETTRELEAVYYPFISEIRLHRPEIPIILTTPPLALYEIWDKEGYEIQQEKRRIIRDGYKKCVDNGDKNIHLVEWLDLMSLADGEGYLDGIHPNDLGFYEMGNFLAGKIKGVLGL